MLSNEKMEQLMEMLGELIDKSQNTQQSKRRKGENPTWKKILN